MRKLLIVGGGILIVAAAGVLVAASGPSMPEPVEAQAPDPAAGSPVLQISDTSSLPGPRQPIFFRHDIHAGLFKIQCQYCHYTVSESSEPGIPSVETCMGCHLVISGSDTASRAEIGKL
ncbi:MAG: cytochrome c3 family protein, partial [Gemmatimonadales bacterium]